MVNTVAKTKVVQLGELILDWSLWPRADANNSQVDRQNVTRLKRKIKMGITLDPIIVDAKTLRIVDGFHRYTAYSELEIQAVMVELRVFKSDAEMFVESARINEAHGMQLTSKDRIHCLLQAKKIGASIHELSAILGLSEDETAVLQSRTARTRSGETLPLPAGVAMLGRLDRALNKNEEDAARRSNCCTAAVNAKLLLRQLRAPETFEMTEQFRVLLVEVKETIEALLK
jgi:hypothetical protein